MYKEHPVCSKPDDENMPIWRYMDFTKLVSLLEKKALFFIKGDMLSDQFEGSYPIPNVESRAANLTGLSEENIKALSRQLCLSKKLVYINSWHMNHCESAAMWKLYLQSNEGIAIKSTIKRLGECFDKADTKIVSIGKVKYIDYDIDKIPESNLLYPFFHKRMSFQHELELRAAVLHIAPEFITDKIDEKGNGELDLTKECKATGLYIAVDLETLVDKIYVSPTAEEWFYELTKSVVAKYTLEKDVKKSDLTRDPVY